MRIYNPQTSATLALYTTILYRLSSTKLQYRFVFNKDCGIDPSFTRFKNGKEL